MAQRIPCPSGGQCGRMTHEKGSEAYRTCASKTATSTSKKMPTVIPPKGITPFSQEYVSWKLETSEGLRELLDVTVLDKQPPSSLQPSWKRANNWNVVRNNETGEEEYLGAMRNDDGRIIYLIHLRRAPRSYETDQYRYYAIDEVRLPGSRYESGTIGHAVSTPMGFSPVGRNAVIPSPHEWKPK